MKPGHQCVVYDHNPESVKALAAEGAVGATVARRLRPASSTPPGRLGHGPRRRPDRADGHGPGRERWSPATRSSTAATPTSRTTSAAPRLLKPKGIHYVDVGTSGGVWGIDRGYCMMIGGPDEAVRPARPDLQDPRPRHGRRPPHARLRREEGRHRRGRLPPLRPLRRGPLRQDGPQRHRVRPDAGLRRGLRHLPATPTRRSCPRPSASTSTSPTSPRSGGEGASSARGCST